MPDVKAAGETKLWRNSGRERDRGHWGGANYTGN